MRIRTKIGIVGCGNMGSALIKGLATGKLVGKSNILAYDAKTSRCRLAAKRFGVQIAKSSRVLVGNCDIVIVAVKPQDFNEALKEIGDTLNSRHLLISVAAGITTQHIRKVVAKEISIVRAMPNMPGLVGVGITAICFQRCAKSNDKALAKRIFEGLGDVVEVKEGLMDAVTALSGSGPAYFFYLVEVLTDVGCKLGLSRKISERLAVKTAAGSAKILEVLQEDAAKLRAKVTSKGGTTEAAFKVFNKFGLGKILELGIQAAAKRARQLQDK